MEVLIGTNDITLNRLTLQKLFADWLSSNLSGGPYVVTSLEWCEDTEVMTLTVKPEPTTKVGETTAAAK